MPNKKIILDPIDEALRRFDPCFVPVRVERDFMNKRLTLMLAAWCTDRETYCTLWFQFAGLGRIVSFMWEKQDADGNDRYSVEIEISEPRILLTELP